MHTLKLVFSRRYFSYLVFATLLMACSFTHAQNVRYSAPFPSVSSTTSTPFLVANIPPNSPVIAVCNSPANQVPCTNYATTYTSAGAACSNGSQDTPDPQPSACQSTGDAQGNIGFWARPGQYDYTVCIQNSTTCLGPYTVTLGGVSGGVTSASPQYGDAPRYNVNGDSAWDPVNMAQPLTYIYPTWGQTAVAIGPMAQGSTAITQLGGTGNINPTATVGVGVAYASSSSASTSTVIGMKLGENGNNSTSGMLNFYRFTMKFQLGGITNARYWLGLACWNASSSLGNNTAGILGTTAYATDTPNKTTLAFRYSSGTDTHWQAVADVAGGSQTTVDTGIVPDANIHLFEMTVNSAGTAVNYFIDTVLVATITTNLPIPAQGKDSWGDVFWTGDNKNTANSVAANFYLMQISHK